MERPMTIGKKAMLLIFASVCVLAACCTSPLFLGQVATWSATGTYYYVNGELKTDYFYSFDQVWSAVENTVTDMKGRDVVANKQIGEGKISAVINDDKVQFNVTYRKKDLTTLSIRVGIIGSEASSKMLQDKIAEHLANKSTKSDKDRVKD
jgi:hypothetical protein